MEKKKEIITCQPRICSFLCSLARYVGSLFPLVLIYTTRATLMTLMKFISSTCYTQYYRKVYIQCQIRTLEHAIRGKTINRLFLFFFVFCLRMPYWTFGQTYRISSYSFRWNYSFLNLEIQRSQYLRPKVTVHKCAKTIQGRKLFKGGNYMRKYGI